MENVYKKQRDEAIQLLRERQRMAREQRFMSPTDFIDAGGPEACEEWNDRVNKLLERYSG